MFPLLFSAAHASQMDLTKSYTPRPGTANAQRRPSQRCASSSNLSLSSQSQGQDGRLSRNGAGGTQYDYEWRKVLYPEFYPSWDGNERGVEDEGEFAHARERDGEGERDGNDDEGDGGETGKSESQDTDAGRTNNKRWFRFPHSFRIFPRRTIFSSSSPSFSSPSKSASKRKKTRPTMANVKTYTWVSAWFAITIPVIFWDMGYCFMRPRSFEGGDLHWLWSPYSIYQNVDLVYGVQAYLDKNGFTNAQSLLNFIENLLNILYLYLAHYSPTPTATLVGFTSAVMTLSKTLLYWLQEYYCGYCAIGHNTWLDVVRYWIVPNGFWIIVPGAIVYTLGRDLSQSLHVAASVQQANGKVKVKKAE